MSYRDLSDEEIVELIMESLTEDGRVTTDFLEVECINGRPIINGRVGEDEQIQVIDEIMNDVLDIHDYENTVWVDDELGFENADEDREGVPSEEDEEPEDDSFDPDEEDEDM